MTKEEKAVLLLSDGTVFEGKSMGAKGKAFGEVVFSTSMVGYQEALTDPANQGFLITQTFPLIGNYGINQKGFSTDRVWASGYIVREICEQPSNYQCKGTLQDFLCEHQIVGISGIDTRQLTRLIREKGEMMGVIASGDTEISLLREELSRKAPETAAPVPFEMQMIESGGTPLYRVAVLDFGITNAAKEALLTRGAQLILLPPESSANQIQALAPDGLFLSDGPSHLADEGKAADRLRKIAELKIPMLAISLSHQLLALSQGMPLRKLNSGHRGANQPVYCHENERTYITAQNHRVVVDSIDSSICRETFHNANDKTNEGLSYLHFPAISVQFLPDPVSSTQSTSFVYDEFFAMMKGKVD